VKAGPKIWGASTSMEFDIVGNLDPHGRHRSLTIDVTNMPKRDSDKNVTFLPYIVVNPPICGQSDNSELSMIVVEFLGEIVFGNR
jgi:hypothetical protein